MNKLKRYTNIISSIKGMRGSYAIMTAILLVVFIGVTALAVDIGYLMATRNELQNVADSAALAGARMLGSIYEPMTYTEQQAYVCDPTTITPVAKDVAFKNQAAGKNIIVDCGDIVIGDWSSSTKSLTPTLNQPDAVEVRARRDSITNGPITTFFAKIFGINTVPVSAVAVAALTSQSSAISGGLPIPVAISECVFQDPNNTGFCGRNIIFYPTTSGEAGWHVFDRNPANANTLDLLLQELTNEIILNGASSSFNTPEVIAGITQLWFTGGTLSSCFPDMAALFNAAKVLNDGVIDADTDPNTWTTSVGIYEADCSAIYNPTGAVLIKGFATIVIEEILTTPTGKEIIGYILCDLTVAGRGGGGDFGTNGSIPGLVM